jgi:signal transduction histidine kinase
LAVVGIGAAIATVHPWGRALPRWLLIGPLSTVSALMILRAVLQMVGDVQRLVHGVSPTSAYTARWDLALWSPYFLLWGILWGMVVYRFASRTRPQPEPAAH